MPNIRSFVKKTTTTKKKKKVTSETTQEISNQVSTTTVSEDPRFDAAKSPRFKKLKVTSKHDNNIRSDPRFEVQKRFHNKPRKDIYGRRITNLSNADDSDDTAAGTPLSSSSSDISEDDHHIEDTPKDIKGFLPAEVEPERSEEVSSRLAIMGCDWNITTASHLFALASSVLEVQNDGGADGILRVAVYPSSYGLNKLKQEETRGPEFPQLYDGEPISEESRLFREQATLRGYERQRSLYYFGLIECGSTHTALRVYDFLDGVDSEFAVESIDVRFVPDGLEIPHKAISEATSLPENYKPMETNARHLKHSKLECSWDVTPLDRQRLLQRKPTEEELAGNDLDVFLASSSSDEESKAQALKMRADLLGDIIVNEEISENPNDGGTTVLNPPENKAWTKYLSTKTLQEKGHRRLLRRAANLDKTGKTKAPQSEQKQEEQEEGQRISKKERKLKKQMKRKEDEDEDSGFKVDYNDPRLVSRMRDDPDFVVDVTRLSKRKNGFKTQRRSVPQ